MKNCLFLSVLALLAFLSGCMLGPKYRRPPVSAPPSYRASSPSATQPAVSLGAEKWSQVFQDPVLQKLVHRALRKNYDVRIAATRVVEAQAELRITRASQFPSAALGLQLFSQGIPKTSKVFPAYQVNAGHLSLSAIWDLDFWGKYRSETEAARADVLGTEWGQRAVLSSVVAGVASSYFKLRALDDELQIATRALTSRQDSLRLINVLADHGSASQLDVSEARQLVFTASEAIPDLQRQIEQQENLLSILLGENPGPIPRGLPLTSQPVPLAIPAGLPSELLDRRPEVREAEDSLIAANATIGVLKAALFPDISLTGTGGVESNALNRILSGSSHAWLGSINISQPIFQAGALHTGVRLAQAQREQMVLTYQQTIQNAFRQVSDALIAYQKYREFGEQQEKLAQAAQNSDRLSQILYSHGSASYLQVLTSQTNLLAAQLNLVEAQLNERLSFVQIYQALGGGWQR
ncbi:MAG: efflux transporter outer membrane subunit [Candidatus Acidiferrales bacterium]